MQKHISNRSGVYAITKDVLTNKMADNLPTLRACLKMSQAELANKIGLSRSSIIAIETKKRKMQWSTFLSLLLVFSENPTASKCLFVFGLAGPEVDAFIKG